jgi:hypothetical protein
MSSLLPSTYAGDEKAVWQDFRRVLIQKGFRDRTLGTYREVLEAYMLRLDQSGLLDQDTVPASTPTNESTLVVEENVYGNRPIFVRLTSKRRGYRIL